MFEICLLSIDNKKTDRTLRYTRSTDYAQYSDRALIEGCLETDRQRGRKKEREKERRRKNSHSKRQRGYSSFTAVRKMIEEVRGKERTKTKKRRDTIDHSFRLGLRESRKRTRVLEAVAGKEIQTNV